MLGPQTPASGMDPNPDRYGIQPKMLDPYPYQMNTDPLWLKQKV